MTSVPLSFDELLALASRLIWIIFAIFVVVLFVGGLVRRGIRTAIIWLFSYRVLLPLLTAVSISLLSASIVFIYPTEVSVVVSIISPNGIRPQPAEAGLHFIVPILEYEVRYPIYWQTYTMSPKPWEGDLPVDDGIVARTSDGQEVTLECSVIFRVDPVQVVRVYIDWQDRYIDDLVRPVTQGVVRDEVSKYTVTEVNSQARQDLQAELNRLLGIQFVDRGFILDQFVLREISFSEEYAAAVELKQVALEGEIRTEYEAEQIRKLADGEADAVRIQAEGEAEAIRLVAEAEAEALTLYAEALKANRDLLTYSYIDKLSPNIQVMLVPSETPLILPLPPLYPTAAATSTTLSTQTIDSMYVPQTMVAPTAIPAN